MDVSFGFIKLSTVIIITIPNFDKKKTKFSPYYIFIIEIIVILIEIIVILISVITVKITAFCT